MSLFFFIFILQLLKIGPKNFRRTDVIRTFEKKGDDQDPWYIVVDNKVYDIKDFVSDHPGGAVILTQIGKDTTGMHSCDI